MTLLHFTTTGFNRAGPAWFPWPWQRFFEETPDFDPKVPKNEPNAGPAD
jgi:hypothetical protein